MPTITTNPPPDSFPKNSKNPQELTQAQLLLFVAGGLIFEFAAGFYLSGTCL